MTERATSVTPRNRWVLLAVISIGTLSSTLDGGSTAVTYPAVARALDTDTSTVLWITVAFWVTGVGLLLPMGWLGDVAGRRRVFALGSALFALGILLSSMSTNIWQLIAFRCFQGVGSAMLLSNLNALITANFPAHDRGKALGVSGAVAAAGVAPYRPYLLLASFALIGYAVFQLARARRDCASQGCSRRPSLAMWIVVGVASCITAASFLLPYWVS